MDPNLNSTAARSDERIDDLQIGGYQLIQRRGTFCLGTDSVLLADFASPRQRDIAADLGCGNGALSILLAAHCPTLQVDAIELQPEMYELAQRNIALNNLEERMHVHCGDLREAVRYIPASSRSLVVCNPPYWVREHSIVNEESEQNAARFEDAAPEDVCRAAMKLLKYGGRFCVVFPAQRGYEMMNAMDVCGMSPKHVRTVHARIDKAPKIMLIEAIKGGKPGLMWQPPLLLYEADGSASREWARIYGKE